MQQTIAHLEKLKMTPGYKNLKYLAKFVPSPSGDGTETLKSLGIVMPNAPQLLRDFGGVLYADATFGLVLLALKALLVVVRDGECHNHLVAVFLTPGIFIGVWSRGCSTPLMFVNTIQDTARRSGA